MKYHECIARVYHTSKFIGIGIVRTMRVDSIHSAGTKLAFHFQYGVVVMPEVSIKLFKNQVTSEYVVIFALHSASWGAKCATFVSTLALYFSKYFNENCDSGLSCTSTLTRLNLGCQS